MGKKSKQVDDSAKPFGITGMTLGDARDQMGIESHCRFVGYCVCIPFRNEFLGALKSNQMASARGFCIGPDKALRFPSYKAADKQREREKGEVIVGLFDVGTQVYISHAEPTNKG